VVPRDSMPQAMRFLSSIDPLRYYADVARGVILKGNGMDILWFDVVLLLFFAMMTLALSLLRFRRQTS
jgi:ABC-2 type transport system permease protein